MFERSFPPGKCESPLFAALPTAAERRVHEFARAELARTVWAFATATQADALLFAALARVAERRLGLVLASMASGNETCTRGSCGEDKQQKSGSLD